MQSAPLGEVSLFSIDRYLTEPTAEALLSPSTQAALQRGDVIELRDAFVRPIAERVHGVLDGTDAWVPVENHGSEEVLRRHHRLDDPLAFPEVSACHAVFDSAATKRFVGRVTGLSCLGSVEFGVTRYLPGEYSLPHTDGATLGREVAFLWYLTRDWSPKWGGELYVCDPWRCVRPTFNTLVLFRVTPRSQHFVAPVSPFATGKRMTVAGWWTRARE
jgi:Rps23 Pro-64 3,4-dihydroxylase Tpa1-like proline 4-hydroxylase